jgi:hypothetical protein
MALVHAPIVANGGRSCLPGVLRRMAVKEDGVRAD